MVDNSSPLKATLKEKLANLPEKPGVYLFKDFQGQTLYVGKAKVLWNRVHSYFRGENNPNPRLQLLQNKIVDLDYFLCDSEIEALMLEYNLIKQHHPPFNILFRDDKRLPLIKVVLNTPFPYITIARKRQEDGNRYFGPYISTRDMRQTLKVIRKIFQIRSCTMKITGHDRPCLYYHLKECTAPCISAVSREEYQKSIEGVIQFLEGKGKSLLDDLTARMDEASNRLEFERAALIRNQIMALKPILTRQKVSSHRETDEDYAAVALEKGLSAGQVFHVREGKLIGKDHYIFETAESSPEQVLSHFLVKYYEENPIPAQIVVQHQVEDLKSLEEFLSQKAAIRVELVVPQRGEKKKMLDLLAKNANHQLGLALLKEARTRGMLEALQNLQQQFNLPNLPFRIEGYDISNLFGQEAVGSMVVFEGGRPSKNHYRKFAIYSKNTPDDFAMMREMLIRRLSRLSKEDEDESFGSPPDLILLDGGKGQLSIGVAVLRDLGLTGMPILSLAKEEEEIYHPALPRPVRLSRHHPGLKLLQHVRDEAHRFAVSFHKAKRDKKMAKSILEEIPGIGSKRTQMLLEAFGSIDQIRVAEASQIAKVLRCSKTLAGKILTRLTY